MTERIVVSVRPRRALLSSAFFSILLAMIPVFGVLYWFSIVHDGWWMVLVANIVVVALATAALLRQLTVYSAVTDTQLEGRGIFSPVVRVPLERIAGVHLIETYLGQGPEKVTQLLVTDQEGRRLFRMRGNFWHPGDLRAIADALPVAVKVISEPMSMDEFYRNFPGSAYWFEHRPILRVVAIIAGVLLAVLITVLAMNALGMPLSFQRD